MYKILRLLNTINTRKYATLRRTQQKKHEKYDELIEKFKEKILFNSHLNYVQLTTNHNQYYTAQKKRERFEYRKQMERLRLPPLPASLKYLVEKDRLLTKNEDIVQPEWSKFQLPYENPDKIEKVHEVVKESNQRDEEFDRTNMHKWMTDYEHYDDTILEDEDVSMSWTSNYGTPDPKAKLSRIPCGGCGALLHCSDVSIPGYIPSEIFKGRTDDELKTIECQRCHFLKEFNIALDTNVEPNEYLALLETIKNKRALVLLMIDVLDFPCSIWPGLIDIIGVKRPVFIIGNKIDLLPIDEMGHLKRVQSTILKEIKKTPLGQANIKHVSLISAKTGFGIEELISNLFKLWLYKGDVYIIGCTNVGKSSLFNALLQSDYCKVHAQDLIKRATVSRWPGTTLNLLKFPINRPSGWKIYYRNQRLKVDAKIQQAEQALQETKNQKVISLEGHIGRSFSNIDNLDTRGSFAVGGDRSIDTFGIDEKDEVFKNSRWLFDTPGVVHPDQILSILTTEELLQILPKKTIKPHCYFLKPGTSILIGGLSRLDFIECSTYPSRFTVFCSENIPITICKTEDADELYNKFLGSDLLGVPRGSNERLKNWPGLKAHEKQIEVVGEGMKVCCADIVLSTSGWVSVSAPHGLTCKIQAWTPMSKGIHVRKPLLRYAIMLKGTRIRDTPAYRLADFQI